MDEELEADLLDKARRGDATAAPFLISCYGERLLGYAHDHAPDLSDADRERIVEMAVEAGVRSIGRFDPTLGTLYSWFRGQVRFQTLGWRRSQPIVGPLPADVAAVATDEPTAPSERTIALARAVGRLSHDDQIVLALRSVERLDFAAVAHRLGIEEAAARQRHSRARKRLVREALKEDALRQLGEEEQ